jgi:hypothetical protein
MAKRTTWHCDRCGKEFNRKGITGNVKVPRKISRLLYDGIRCFSEQEYDLCRECFGDFIRYICGRKVEDGK